MNFDFDSPLIDFEGRPTDAFFAQLMVKVEGIPAAVLAAAAVAPIKAEIVAGQGTIADKIAAHPKTLTAPKFIALK